MVKIGDISIGNNNPFVLIAGPCIVENEKIVMKTAEEIAKITNELGIKFIFKSSYKKANRTSFKSFTGIGNEDALKIISMVKEQFSVPLLTDVHTETEVDFAAEYVDVLQIPAFLCRQTELLVRAGKSGKVVNIKKGQFLAPEDMKHVIGKILATGNEKIMLTERGTSFGYHNLVVDMRSLVIMKELGYPVVMDATHAVQLPSKGDSSSGQREFIKPLAKAAAAVGIDALFLEVHPNPKEALSDADSQLQLSDLRDLLIEVRAIDRINKKIS
jgi:2-dehydro-3-deoxyphosphooctonate aldolase (KDO 8-P synthase)